MDTFVRLMAIFCARFAERNSGGGARAPKPPSAPLLTPRVLSRRTGSL